MGRPCGCLHSEHPNALAAGAPSFLNKRTVTLLERGHFVPLLLAEVGALLVGRIVQTHSPGTVSRGQEKARCQGFGGLICALMRDGDTSARLSKRYRELTVMRRYAVFARSLRLGGESCRLPPRGPMH